VEQPPQFHPEGDVWTHTLLMLEQLPAGTSPTLAWGVLLHDVGKPPTFTPPSGPNGRIRFDEHVEVGTRMAQEIARRLRFSNDDTEQIAALVANHLRFKDVPQMRPATLSASSASLNSKSTSNCTGLTVFRAIATSRATNSFADSWPRPRPSRSALPG